MAVFTDVSSFANHIASYGAKIEGVQPKAVKAAAEAARAVVEVQGSRFHIKGRRGRGVHLGATVEGPYGFGNDWIAYVKPVPAGFWAIVEKGTRPHAIKPRRAKALGPIPGGYFAVVHHPGSHGASGRPWSRAVDLASPVAERAYQAVVISVFGLAA